MRLLEGKEEKNARYYMDKAINVAGYATCLKRKCGAVIVSEEIIIGEGFNSPAQNSELNRVCMEDKKSLDNKVTDKTCCAHAEIRALEDALDKYNKLKLKRAVLFFASVDENGEKIFSGKPYCTICSKSALDKGLKGWVLEHEEGLYFYGAKEYHDLSRNYKS